MKGLYTIEIGGVFVVKAHATFAKVRALALLLSKGSPCKIIAENGAEFFL